MHFAIQNARGYILRIEIKSNAKHNDKPDQMKTNTFKWKTEEQTKRNQRMERTKEIKTKKIFKAQNVSNNNIDLKEKINTEKQKKIHN